LGKVLWPFIDVSHRHILLGGRVNGWLTRINAEKPPRLAQLHKCGVRLKLTLKGCDFFVQGVNESGHTNNSSFQGLFCHVFCINATLKT
jgi:hypothetical protein